MSRTYKLTVTVALFVLVVSAVATGAGMHNGLISTVLLFVLPALWILWIVCVFLDARRSIWRLFILWGLIDAAALVLLNLIISNAGNATGPGGEDVAFVIAFSPLNWPIVLLSRYLPDGFMVAIPHFFSALPEIRPIIADWLSMSLIAAIPSLFVGGIGRLRWVRQRKSGTDHTIRI